MLTEDQQVETLFDQQEGFTANWTARRLKVPVGEVLAVLARGRVIRDVKTYRRVKRYWCEKCKAMVSLKPCLVCRARANFSP